jgi:hypothetical protein
MQKQLFRYTLAASVLAAGTLLQAIPAHAAIVSCPLNISSLVSPSSGCEYSTTFDNDNPTSNVNAEGGFFDFTDWTRILKSDQGGTVVPDFFSSSGGQSGTFDLTGTSASSAANVMLIFKSGDNTTLVGYLLNGLSGSWSSPFRDPPFTGLNANQIRDVSHISVYTRGSGAAIPTPALLPGIAGMGLALLRKKKQEQEVTQEV